MPVPNTAGILQAMLQAGLIVAGWDPVEGGSVYAIPLGGTLVKCPFAIGKICVLQLSLYASCGNTHVYDLHKCTHGCL